MKTRFPPPGSVQSEKRDKKQIIHIVCSQIIHKPNLTLRTTGVVGMLREFKGRGEFTSEMGIWCPELGWNSQWDCGGAQ